MFSETEFTWEDVKQSNRNPLLYLNVGADGLKTGHTNESGYSLAASAVRGERRLVLVVAGLDSVRGRSAEAQRADLLGIPRVCKRGRIWSGGVPCGSGSLDGGRRQD